MSRHLLATLIIALPVAITILLLGDAPFFEMFSRWLLERFQAEGLAKGNLAPAAWLQSFAVLASAFGLAWVAVDLGQTAAKVAIAAVAALLWSFLSLTLAFYGLFFDPFPAVAASLLALISGLCFAETPRGRRSRDISKWFGGRVSQKTLAELRALGLPLEAAPETREVAVLACRVATMPRSRENAGEFVQAVRALLEEAADFLRGRPRVVLDLPEADGVRAFFGFLAEAPNASTAEACAAALELKGYLEEFAQLNRQAGRSPLAFGIGVSTGPLVIGLLGTRAQPAGTASGPAADHARHLAATAIRYREGILLGRRAAQLAGENFELRALEGESLHLLINTRDQPAEELGVAEEVVSPSSPPAAPQPPPVVIPADAGAVPAVSNEPPAASPPAESAEKDVSVAPPAGLSPLSALPGTPPLPAKPKALRKKPRSGPADPQQKTG